MQGLWLPLCKVRWRIIPWVIASTLTECNEQFVVFVVVVAVEELVMVVAVVALVVVVVTIVGV